MARVVMVDSASVLLYGAPAVVWVKHEYAPDPKGIWGRVLFLVIFLILNKFTFVHWHGRAGTALDL